MFGISSKSKNIFDPKLLGRACCNLWNSYFGLFLVFFSFIFLSLGSYVWYKNVYLEGWNDNEKSDYKINKKEETSLKEKVFDDVLANIEKRKIDYEERGAIVRDIFSSYTKIENKDESQDKDNNKKNNSSNNQPPIFFN